MNFTDEMINKAKTAASAAELLEMAKAEGVELTAEEAEQYYNFLNGSAELSDDELGAVAGGKNNDDPKPNPKPNPKFQYGQTVRVRTGSSWSSFTGYIVTYYYTDNGYIYDVRMEPKYQVYPFPEDRLGAMDE